MRISSAIERPYVAEIQQLPLSSQMALARLA
jgi:hypothetical protein